MKSPKILSEFSMIVLAGLLLSGCAAFRTAPPAPPLSEPQVEKVLSGISQEDGRVTSLYSKGTLLFKDWLREEESSTVIAGSREPFRVKIEVTHSWGQPILHILIDRSRLEVLSFAESRLYMGDFTPEALSRFIPGSLSRELIWSVLRGYPVLRSYQRGISPRANRIELFGAGEERVETIELDENLQPVQVSLPAQEIVLTFSDIRESDGIAYAGGVGVDQKKARGKLFLRNEKMVFNRPIPNEVFSIEKPPAFTVVQMDRATGSDRGLEP